MPKPPVKELVIVPVFVTHSTTSKEVICTSLGIDILEMSRVAAASEVNKALSDLGELVKTGDYQEGNTIIARILTQLDLIPGSAISVEVGRGPFHDARHCASSLLDAFMIIKKSGLSDRLKSSIDENFFLMKSLLNEVFKSGSPTLVSSRYKPEKVWDIANSVVSLCAVSAIKNRTTLDSPIIDSPLTSYAITNKGHALAIRRVLHNLIGNAIHYSSGVAAPRVTLTLILGLTPDF